MRSCFKFVALSLLLLACSGPENPDTMPEDGPDDSLNAVATARVTVHNEWLANMRQIGRTLDSIDAARDILSLKTGDRPELTPNLVSDINTRIIALNSLLKRNEQYILQLNKELQHSTRLNAGLKDSVNELNALLIEKQKEMMGLHEKISGLDNRLYTLEAQLYTLYAQNAFQNRSIVKSIEAANTVYYILGSKKALKQKGILDQGSGLISFGPGTLSEEIDPAAFIKADQRDKKDFLINSPHAKLLTLHSTKSYRFEKKGKIIMRLIITDPTEFWRISRFLVIETE